MRRARGLFDRLVDPDHLVEAARLTARGKRRRRAVAGFLARRHALLARIRAELMAGAWRPAPFEILQIHDPKPRIIGVAPVVDRVVYTALVEAMAPAILPGVMPESFACRRGTGVHRAVYAIRRAMARHRFAIHLDVKVFFPSIDVSILQWLLARRIADDRFLDVLDRTIDVGLDLYRRPEIRVFAGLTDDWPPAERGLPIGTATSQFCATHVYLGGLDHYIKRALKVPAAVRFVDDVLIFGDRRADLRAWRWAIGEWLMAERGLRLKHPEARIVSCAGTLNALGHRIRRGEDQALPRARRRFVRRCKGIVAGQDVPRDVRASVAAGVGVRLF